MRRLPSLTDHAGLLGVIAAEAAFTEGDEWLDAVLRRLTANRTLLGERLAAELPDIDWTPPDATYLAWLDCRRLGLGDDPAAAFLRHGRVALSPGLDYGPEGGGFVRLNFGTSPEHLVDIVRRMRHAADASRDRRSRSLNRRRGGGRSQATQLGHGARYRAAHDARAARAGPSARAHDRRRC